MAAKRSNPSEAATKQKALYDGVVNPVANDTNTSPGTGKSKGKKSPAKGSR